MHFTVEKRGEFGARHASSGWGASDTGESSRRQLQERAEKIPGDKKHVEGMLSQSHCVAQFTTAHRLPSSSLASFASQGYPFRMCTAVALTDSSIRTIKKEEMLQLIRRSNETSNSLVAHLLSSGKKYRDHVADLLTSSADQRLAHVLIAVSALG